ncbi:MAG: helix-turn-helix transcriptional regulator [Clostridia bacterium]|nr:helix-turn-helix transcriptional regulator [Clostridia bacterium]
MIRLVLNQYLDKKGITRYELSKRTGIRFQIVDNYYKNKVVRYDSDLLNRMCEALNCDITDLIEYQKDETP